MSVSSIGSVGSYSFIDRMVMSAMNRPSKTQGEGFNLSQLASQIVQKDDANGDGLLSASETKLDSDMFKKLDADGDGKLTTDELVSGLQNNRMRPMGPPPPPPPMDSAEMASSIMQDEDANEDGVLSIDETELGSDEFNILDTDGDGKVTTDELQAGIKARESERAKEMAAMAREGSLAASDTTSPLQSLLQALSQNEASNAYGDQNWLYQMLQSSAQNLAVSA